MGESSPSALDMSPMIREKATMAAAVITGPRAVEIRSVPMPEPGRGQVRVKLEGCRVCASNLPVWQGRPYFHDPLEPGTKPGDGWKPSVRAAVQGDVPTQESLTHRDSLAELPLAMRDMEERPEGFLKGWINYD